MAVGERISVVKCCRELYTGLISEKKVNEGSCTHKWQSDHIKYTFSNPHQLVTSPGLHYVYDFPHFHWIQL